MLGLDHIVIKASFQNYEAHISKHYGLDARFGGKHEQWGTFNYLTYFQNEAYLEWLFVENNEIAEQSDNPLIHHLLDQEKDGPFQLALHTNHMDDYIKHFRKHLIPFKGPFEGSRKVSESFTLKWRMLFPMGEKGEYYPFLIEWDDPYAKRTEGKNVTFHTLNEVTLNNISQESFCHVYKIKAEDSNESHVDLYNGKLAFGENFSFHYK